MKTGCLRVLAVIAALLPIAACASRGAVPSPSAQAVDTGKEIVVKTDKGEATAQASGTAACAKKGKKAELTGYTCAEGTCKVLRYTFDCV